MSVPKYKRKESKTEFLHNFSVMRKAIILTLMRDFGIKARKYTVNLVEEIYDINDDEKTILNKICKDHNIDGFDVDKYPQWLIDGWRNEVMMILNNIGIEIYCANSIYITNIQEFYCRRNHWNNAIGYCVALMDKFNEILSCISVNLGEYEHISEMLMKEIKLLKGVRKSDNSVLKKLSTELPYFNNSFVYNNYPTYPFSPNYCANSNKVELVQKVEMCKIVTK